jgi:hypothetical protein
MAKVKIINEVSTENTNDWNLCFQKCKYIYDDNSTEIGFRFIWRKPNNRLQPARGQARIPDEETLYLLLEKARDNKWFN